MPFNIFGCMVMTVTGYTTAIRMQPGATMSCTLLVISSTAFISQFTIAYLASNSSKFSKLAIQRQRRISTAQNATKSLTSCREFGIKSGTFRVLDRNALIIIMMANIDYTISFLLAL